MLHPVLLSSFRSELEKQAMPWQVPLVTGALGAGTGAYLAGKVVLPEHRYEQFLNDMDTMPDEVFKMRTKRRVAAMTAATALGAAAGAGLPFAAEYGASRLGELLRTKGHEVVQKGAKKGGEVAAEAGKNFAEGMAGQFEKHKSELADAVEEAGRRAAKGAKKEFNLKDLIFGVKGASAPKNQFDAEDLARGTGVLALGAGAKSLGESGLERVVGAQRIHHGTGSQAAKSIMEKGLDPSFGGRGAAAAIDHSRYVRESQGKVHVVAGGQPGVARFFAGLGEAAERHPSLAGVKGPERDAKILLEGFKNQMLGRGKVIGGAIPYRDFAHHFEIDPDMPTGGAYRGTMHIAPENLQGAGVRGILRGRDKDLLRYISEHPGRAARGAGMVGLGGLASYGAYRMAKPTLLKIKNRLMD